MGKEAKSTSITNRKAWHEYTIEDTFEAGIELVGTEVKSVRAGQVNMLDAYCRILNGEVFVIGMDITPYEYANRSTTDRMRTRKLLLRKEQIEQLKVKADQRGLSIIPLKIYFTRGFAKMEIGIGRGKKTYDKRQAIADRDVERDRRRAESGRE